MERKRACGLRMDGWMEWSVGRLVEPNNKTTTTALVVHTKFLAENALGTVSLSCVCVLHCIIYGYEDKVNDILASAKNSSENKEQATNSSNNGACAHFEPWTNERTTREPNIPKITRLSAGDGESGTTTKIKMIKTPGCCKPSWLSVSGVTVKNEDDLLLAIRRFPSHRWRGRSKTKMQCLCLKFNIIIICWCSFWCQSSGGKKGERRSSSCWIYDCCYYSLEMQSKSAMEF